MPVVPQRYGQRQVSTNPLPGARRSASDTALALGAGVEMERARTAETIANVAGGFASMAANEYSDMVRKERAAADNTALLEAKNKLARFQQDELWGDKGVFSRTGRDSFDAPETSTQRFNERASEIEASLTTQEQRDRFNEMRNAEGLSFETTVRRYVRGEIDKFSKEQHDGALTNARNQAIQSASLPGHSPTERMEGVNDNLVFGIAEIRRYGKDKGTAKELVESQIEAFRSNVHDGVISGFISNGEVDAAEQYFEEAEAQLLPEARERVAKALEEGVRRDKVHKVVDEIVQRGGSLEEQREAVKASTDGKVRDEALQLIEHEWSVRETQRRVRHEGVLLGAKQIIDRTGDWRNIPAADWASFDVGESGSLKNYAEAMAKGKAIETDTNSLYYLINLATSGDPAMRTAFTNINMMEYVDKLDKDDLEQMMRLQGSTRTTMSEADRARLSSLGNQNQIINGALLGMGIDPSPAQPGTKGFDAGAAERANQFRASVRQAIQRFEQRADIKREATDEDVQTIVDHLRAQVATERTGGIAGFFGSDRPRFAFEGTGPMIVWDIARVPHTERLKIEDSLRRDKKPISNEAILLLFNQGLARTTNRDIHLTPPKRE